MNEKTLEEMKIKVAREGPNRVLIDAEGTAVSLRRALERGVVPVVIFIREDGWSLGAPLSLEKQAEQLWPKEWVGKIRIPVSPE